MTVWVSKIFSQWGVVKELYITLYYHFLKCILEDIQILGCGKLPTVFPNYDSEGKSRQQGFWRADMNFLGLEPVGLSAQMGRSYTSILFRLLYEGIKKKIPWKHIDLDKKMEILSFIKIREPTPSSIKEPYPWLDAQIIYIDLLKLEGNYCREFLLLQFLGTWGNALFHREIGWLVIVFWVFPTFMTWFSISDFLCQCDTASSWHNFTLGRHQFVSLGRQSVGSHPVLFVLRFLTAACTSKPYNSCSI